MTPTSVAIVASEGFSTFHFSVPLILFGDSASSETHFRRIICAETPGMVWSKEGTAVLATADFIALTQSDIVIVPFWRDVNEKPSTALLAALKTARANGATVVGLCLGTFVLAYAGLLDHRRAATHWEYEPDFSRLFPQVTLDVNVLYTDDDGLITSAGTAAALDCCLYVIRQRLGASVANQIARRMVTPPHREGGQAQFIEPTVPLRTDDTRINQLLLFLQNNLGQTLNIDSLAERAAMSRRTLTRHFQKATGMSIGEWITAERLRRSQSLLESSQLSIEQVAERAGFQSSITFRQTFRERMGVSPGEWRKTFRG
ncbi:helix-turn-helix domain-containing protein [Klebsiella sp. WP8-S18-ESBL-06]|uniref:GlxA family transcriptional regulator n=1 Tax=Klebsiella sp. WP8-S18-ESBL-06 TaxID=2675726 RepID=UPI0015DD34E1|nr:helix-turn-helix domain-containing protein [Klebsiella sp. WP8-S18-ESBL-06]BBT70947.1 AraC family transcriptional regulator [Klebsiella sp. WP8-S18-ESBL-06]